ncbi:MAG: hypothetical protein P0S95_07140 [Rhabdochlamydiaceae bacterium]|nr:hypothetical protein [Candidatus Amphrikana amoebophyrae]
MSVSSRENWTFEETTALQTVVLEMGLDLNGDPWEVKRFKWASCEKKLKEQKIYKTGKQCKERCWSFLFSKTAFYAHPINFGFKSVVIALSERELSIISLLYDSLDHSHNLAAKALKLVNDKLHKTSGHKPLFLEGYFRTPSALKNLYYTQKRKNGGHFPFLSSQTKISDSDLKITNRIIEQLTDKTTVRKKRDRPTVDSVDSTPYLRVVKPRGEIVAPVMRVTPLLPDCEAVIEESKPKQEESVDVFAKRCTIITERPTIDPWQTLEFLKLCDYRGEWPHNIKAIDTLMTRMPSDTVLSEAAPKALPELINWSF